LTVYTFWQQKNDGQKNAQNRSYIFLPVIFLLILSASRKITGRKMIKCWSEQNYVSQNLALRAAGSFGHNHFGLDVLCT
jgi:hypothetical protein